MERVIGVEPTTLCLASIRSSQLSYTRISVSFLLQTSVFVNLAAASLSRSLLQKTEKLDVIIHAGP